MPYDEGDDVTEELISLTPVQGVGQYAIAGNPTRAVASPEARMESVDVPGC